MVKENIFAGINQTIMLTLSLIVIASMIRIPGLGQGVLAAVQRSEVGNGFVYGSVVLAIILDRFTQAMNRPKKSVMPKKKKCIITAIIALLVLIIIIYILFSY